ncbi:S-layer homology domain-containing protein [Neglectibacter timonensis]|uniref:S-layer homology domain-containing protein n=5 Tax=Neglectibacter timonensis TaxID=1776382 RepID=UPI00321A7E39
MKRIGKRLLACFLAAAMAFTVPAVPAYAAVSQTSGNTAVQNAALLEALRQEYGGDAEKLMGVLTQYGLLDDKGNLKTSEKIDLDGKEYTLDQLEALLDDPATDLSRVAKVDGDPVTLENLKLMVEIERELARIQAAYFTERSLTPEQADSLLSFYQAAQNGEVSLISSPYTPSIYDHTARVRMKVDKNEVKNEAGTVTATFSLAEPLNYEVSFKVQTLDGSALAGTHYTAVDKEVKIAVGETSVDVKIPILAISENWNTKDDLWDGKRSFFLRAYDAKDVLFADDSGDREALTQQIDITMKYDFGSGKQELSVNKNNYNEALPLTDPMKYLVNKGVVNKLTMSYNSEVSGSAFSFDSFLHGSQNYGIVCNVFLYRGFEASIKTGDTDLLSGSKGYQYYSTRKYGDEVNTDWNDNPTYYTANDYRDQFAPYQGFDVNAAVNVGSEASRTITDLAPYRESLCTKGITLHGAAQESRMVIIQAGYGGQNGYTRTTNGVPPKGQNFAYGEADLNNTYDSACDQFPWYGYDKKTSTAIALSDTKMPTVRSIKAPEGVNFYEGDVIPVTVEFDEPVKAGDVDFRVLQNATGTAATQLEPADSGLTAERHTFLYTVKATDNTTIYPSYLSFADLQGNKGTTLDGNSYFEAKELCKKGIKAPLSKAAFGTLDVTMGEDKTTKKPVATVTVPLSDVAEAVSDVLAMGKPNSEDNKFYLNELQVSLDGGTSKQPFWFDDDKNPTQLVCEIPLDYNTTGEELPFTAELWWQGALLLGKKADGKVPSTVFAESKDFSIVPSADFEEYAGKKTLFYQDFLGKSLPSLSLGRQINNEKITFQQDDDFKWSSGNDTVATIDEKGVISLTGKSGEVDFTLTALNGGVKEKEATNTTAKLKVDMGSTPFLSVPAGQDRIAVTKGQSAVLNWTSNLSEKNQAAKPGEIVETSFTAELYAAGDCEIDGAGKVTGVKKEKDKESLWSKTVTGTAEKPAATVSVPKEKLTELGSPAYVVRVSSGGLALYFQITVISPPAVVDLARPDGGLYVLDSIESLPLSYTFSNFVKDQEGSQYELYIVNSRGEEIARETDLKKLTEEDGKLSGKYTLEIPKVELNKADKESYRDVYTVALKAKNGTDANWSYDSFLLYVYSDGALKLWIDGEEAPASLEMTNVPQISGLYEEYEFEVAQEQVLDMERDINLKRMISINYGDYAWGALCDRVKWAETDGREKGSVATVNYNRGGLYENIEYFDRSSYAPTDQFILSGLAEGEARVTVEHALTGDSAALDLSVKTLAGKLYLFQCYPKLTTTLTYTNGKGERKTVKSEEDGRAAIYEESGIASDVYCRSEATEGGDSAVYLGTVYQPNLVSGERDSTRLELYPLNNLQLRRAAQATLYFKQPDGTPYTGSVIFRGGVYREGEYAEKAQFAFQGEETVSKNGAEDQTVNLGPDGKLAVTMDITQFTTASRPDAVQDAVQAGENIQYIMELRFGNDKDYQPIFTSVDASLNEADITSSGDAIYTLTKAEKKAPFIAGQSTRYAEKGDRFPVLGYTGNVGPNTTYPSVWLSTSVLWWGDELPENVKKAANSVTIQDASQQTLLNQTVENTVYPFSTMLLTTHTVRVDQRSMDRLGMATYDARNLKITLTRDGKNAYQSSTLPFKLVNMIGAPASESAESLTAALNQLGGTSVDAKEGGKMDTADKLLQMGMKLVSSDSNYSTEKTGFSLKLSPTEDPLRFLGFITANAGNMESGHNVTGVYPADGSGGGKKQTSDFDYVPSIFSIAQMCKGTYLGKQEADAMDAIEGKGVRSLSFDLGGYMESEIVYNTTHKKWEIHVLNGGFHAGGGVSYSWQSNMVVGVVPVVISLTLGGTIEVSMDAQDGNYTYYLGGVDTAPNPDTVKVSMADTDFLTELRVYLYARIFAGIGFDISIVALKVGIFGQIDADMQFQWLNRPYLGGENKGYALSDVGAENTRDQAVLDGQHFSATGTAGIEFYFKFLFVSYEKIFASKSIELFNTGTGQWDQIQDIWAANAKINGAKVRRMSVNGQTCYEVDLGAQLEDRSYLNSGVPRIWGSPANGISLLSMDTQQGVTESLQTNAYPYSNPVVSDDGHMMAYLSDMGNADVSATRAMCSVKDGGSFPVGSPISDEGYGDSSLQLAGTADNAVAVWVRQSQQVAKEITGYDGENNPIYAPLTPEDQALQSNSTEVMASLWNGTGWETTRLTENGTPDLAPVAATNGEKTIVAWRSAVPSSNEAVTTFDQQDKILCRVYDHATKNWGEAFTLYDGSSAAGAVKGLQIAMMADGAAAVAYTLDTSAGQTQNDTSGWETMAAIVPAGGSGKDAVRTIRLTDDKALDENPQIAAVSFGETQRFVVGWHTQQTVTESGNLEDDIRLAAFDADGALYNGMPDSVGVIAAGTDLRVGSNFRFAKNAGSIEDLSLVWVDSVAPEDGGKAEDLDEAYEEVGYDVLKAVKFINVQDQLSLSAAVEVAKMKGENGKPNSLVDHFDAWMDNGEVKSILLATSYSGSKTRTVEVEMGGTTTSMELLVADPVSGMYTATGTFINQIEVPTVAFDYDDIYLNTDIPVQFTVRNSGKDPIDSVSIQLGGGGAQTTGGLNLMPNETTILTALCPVGSTVENVDYTVEASFTGGDSDQQSGSLCLDIPDVGFSGLTLDEAADGKRTLRFSLYNQLTAPLTAGRDTVQVAFYSDPSHTLPLLDSSGEELKLTITDEQDLTLINSGAYSRTVTADLTKILGSGTEVPDGGVPVYAMAWIEQQIRPAVLNRRNARSAEMGVIGEFHTSNNYSQLNLQGLLGQYGNAPVHMNSNLTSEGGSTVVTVTIQNNSLKEKTSGNLIVTLLDAGGKVLGQQQSYSAGALNNGLLSLEIEEIRDVQFTFAGQTGASVQVTYSDAVLEEGVTNNAALDQLSLAGVSLTVETREEEDGTEQIWFVGKGRDLNQALLTVVPQDPRAAVQVDKTEYTAARQLRLSGGLNRYTVTITAPDGTTVQTYYLEVSNTLSPSGGGSGYSVTVPEKTDHGTVTANPDQAEEGQAVAITVTPEQGYMLEKLTAVDEKGNKLTLTNLGDGKYTFTMPGSKVEVQAAFKPAAFPFADVSESDWFYGSVKYVYENGMMNGTGYTTFSPCLNTSRGMIMTVLYRLEGSPAVSGGSGFTDVAAGQYYTDAIAWGSAHSIVLGYENNRFGPDDDVTREQLAAILYRYAQYKGYDVTAGGSGVITGYEDAETVSSYAVTPMKWAVGTGVINGSENRLLPRNMATRGEAAAMFMRFCRKVAQAAR